MALVEQLFLLALFGGLGALVYVLVKHGNDVPSRPLMRPKIEKPADLFYCAGCGHRHRRDQMQWQDYATFRCTVHCADVFDRSPMR